ncbi:MFS transporter [Corynebacterium sp. TAE3-ERU30]|nr:MFS transporter [Corynebacterium sp. TAE3-ERU30]
MRRVMRRLAHTQDKEKRPVPPLPKEIWALVAAAFIIAVGFGIVAPIIPQFARSFDVSLAAASAVVSVFAGSRLLFAPVSGRAIDRLGSRKVYLTGLITVAITTGLVGAVSDYWQIVVLRGIGGIGSTMFTVSAMGLIVRMAPPEVRGKASSIYATGFLVGNIVGPVVGAALSFMGMRAPFFIYGATVLLAAAVVYVMLSAEAIGSYENTNTLAPMTFSEAWRDSAYRAALVSAFANGWSNFGVRVAIIPLFSAAMFHQAGAVAGIALAFFAGGNALALQFSGRLSDQWGRKPLVITGLVINAVFTASIGLTQEPITLLTVSVFAGFGAGCLNPAQQAALADVVGRERSGGRVLANFQMAQDFGTITGPIVVGALAGWVGYGWAFASCGLIGFTAAVVWLGARESLESRDDGAAESPCRKG